MFRGFVRDLLCLYVSYNLLVKWPEGIGWDVMAATAFLLLMTVWFLLEKIGVIPKL